MVQIEAWRNQPIEGEQPYLYLDDQKCERIWTTSHRARESTCHKRSMRIGLSPIVGLSGLCRAPVFGSTYAGGTIEELGAASMELTLLSRIWRPKHCPLQVPIRY
jgi:hypothetical protein